MLMQLAMAIVRAAELRLERWPFGRPWLRPYAFCRGRGAP